MRRASRSPLASAAFAEVESFTILNVIPSKFTSSNQSSNLETLKYSPDLYSSNLNGPFPTGLLFK